MLSFVRPRGAFYSSVRLSLNTQSFTEFDPEIYALNQLGICHQIQCLELGESDTFASPSTLRAVATHFDNKFEGSPVTSSSNRQILNELHHLCQERAIAAFNLDPLKWAVSVQPIPAAVALANALLPANGRVIGLRGKWESIDPVIDPRTSLISMPELARNAEAFKPHLIVACASGYPRNIDYKGFRKVADTSGAILIADLAQTTPLVAAGVSPSPFEHCDIVIATAQRGMAAFRSDLVFYRKSEFEKQLGLAFCEETNIPQTAAVAVAMKGASEPEFRNFQYDVVRNMKQLAGYLVGRGVTLKTGGTDHHVAQLDLKGEAVDDRSLQWVLDCANMTTTVGARGLTISSPALTERGLRDRDFEQVGEFLISGVQLAKELKRRHPSETFKGAVQSDPAVASLKKSVVAFARQFPLSRIDGTA